MHNPMDLDELEVGKEYLLVPNYFLESSEDKMYKPKPTIHDGTSSCKSGLRYKFYDEKLGYYFDERLYKLSWIVLDLEDL